MIRFTGDWAAIPPLMGFGSLLQRRFLGTATADPGLRFYRF